MDETIDREAQEIEHWCQSYFACDPNTRPSDSMQRRIRSLWQHAPNWDTMTELNRRYLQRRLPVCAGYGSPPDEETDHFINLLRLHDYGIISTNSCPGWKVQLDNSPAFARQRAYLTFSIPTTPDILVVNTPDALRNFVEELMTSQELYAFIRFKYNDALDGVERDPEITGRMVYGYCCTFPDSKDDEWSEEDFDLVHDANEHVTGIILPQEQRCENSQAWYNYGVSGVDLSGSDFLDDNDPLRASHEADPLQTSVFAKDWDYSEIGQLIEGLLIGSGIMPGFVAGG